MGASVIDFSTSVIIPAYNAEKTIVRTLESVRNQTRIDKIIEVIVVNDGSTDNTERIINEYRMAHKDFPVRLINKKNGGVSKARNTGLEQAQGAWIALLDSDDEWFPNKLEQQMKYIEKDPSIDFIGCNHTDQPIKVFGRTIDKLYKPSIRELCIKMFPQTSTALFRRKIYSEIGGYDETRRYCEDGQFFYKICEKYNYWFCPEQLISFDGGRRGFGISGLSGNLKGMQDGVRKNFRELVQRKSISVTFYVFISLYNEMKYVRRKVVCRLEKK